MFKCKCGETNPENFYTKRKWRCKNCFKAINNKRYSENKEKCQKVIKAWAVKNREKLLANKREYTKTHKKEKIAYDITYRVKNKEKIAKYKKDWEAKRKNEPIFKIKRNLRRRVHHALKDNYKSSDTFTLIGCTAEEFKGHIESLWAEGMSWENYGIEGWHIDHIIPCYKFDLSKPEEQRKCFHYTNQRPLWAKDNLSRPRF